MQSNLQPPVIDSFLQAFTSTVAPVIPFKISSFNSIEDFLIDDTVYVNYRISDADANEYYSDVVPSSAKEGNVTDRLFAASQHNANFEKYKKYKLQIRLISREFGETPTISNLDSKLQYLTEWSTICVITFVDAPQLNLINNLTKEEECIDLVGSLSYAATDVKDYLTGYKITLKEDDEILVQQDSYVAPNNGQINYHFTNNFYSDSTYELSIEYITKYKYHEIVTKTFSPSRTLSNFIEFELLENVEEGAILIKPDVSTLVDGWYYIRRSSAEDNFSYCDDLALIAYDNKELVSFSYRPFAGSGLSVMSYPSKELSQQNIDCFVDKTVKSGVTYRYYLQQAKKVTTDDLSYQFQRVESTDWQERYVIFDKTFLLANNQQLSIEFDENLSGYKRNVLDNKTETLGSKYPYIRRNGMVDYKQITISGLISFLSDANEMFVTKDELKKYTLGLDNFDFYRKEYDITDHNDVILERAFREKVLEFLYADDVKLFRSSPEGNMLVRLTNISLTPKQELGRMIYSFSCTAYEIADDTIENYDKYNILKKKRKKMIRA